MLEEFIEIVVVLTSYILISCLSGDFVGKHYNAIVREIDCRPIVMELHHSGVIPEAVRTRINRAESQGEANGFLYDHLLSQATVETLDMFGQILYSVDPGYARMKEAGRRLLEELQSTRTS